MKIRSILGASILLLVSVQVNAAVIYGLGGAGSDLYSLDINTPCFKDPTSEAGIYCQKRIDCMQNLSPNLIVKQVEHLLIKTENERRVALPAGMANNQLENVSDNLRFQIS